MIIIRLKIRKLYNPRHDKFKECLLPDKKTRLSGLIHQSQSPLTRQMVRFRVQYKVSSRIQSQLQKIVQVKRFQYINGKPK